MSAWLLILIALLYVATSVALSLYLLKKSVIKTNKHVGILLLKSLTAHVGFYVFASAVGAALLMLHPENCTLIESTEVQPFGACVKSNLQAMLMLLVVPLLAGITVSIPLVAWKAAANISKK